MKPLPIPKTVLWILFVVGWASLLAGYVDSFTDAIPIPAYILLATGLSLQAIVWIVLIVDALRHPLYQKTFWIVLFILLPNLVPLAYLPLREKLIDMGMRRAGKMDFKKKQQEMKRP